MLHSPSARDLLRKLKKENQTKKEKPSNKIKQKSLQEVVEKVLNPKTMNRTKHVVNKRKFKNISRKMLLVKMFSHRTNREALQEEHRVGVEHDWTKSEVVNLVNCSQENFLVNVKPED